MTPTPGSKVTAKPVKVSRRERRAQARETKDHTGQDRPGQDQAPVRIRPKRPNGRGWTGRGGGASQYIQAPDMWRGTTVQVCGLWPYAIGTGSPMIGVPLGRHLHSGATVCCDPISWFQRAKLISNPSVFVLGLPALGKSTLVRRMAGGLAGFGTPPSYRA